MIGKQVVITIGRVVDDKAFTVIYDNDIPAFKRDAFIDMLDDMSDTDPSYGWIKSKVQTVVLKQDSEAVFVFAHLNRHLISNENGFDNIYKFEVEERHNTIW